MKTIKQLIILSVLIFPFSFSAKSQGWIQDRKAMYSAGIGASQNIFLPARYYDFPSRNSLALNINISGEYKVHRLISIGWQTGLNYFSYGRYYSQSDNIYYNTAVIGIPAGFEANVHILEATAAKVKDKLDVYAGFNIGGGPAFLTGPDRGVGGFIYAGPQAGARYWFSNKFAVFGEIGWGASVVNAGITF